MSWAQFHAKSTLGLADVKAAQTVVIQGIEIGPKDSIPGLCECKLSLGPALGLTPMCSKGAVSAASAWLGFVSSGPIRLVFCPYFLLQIQQL